METGVDSPEAHPLGLCRILGLLAGQFDSWTKSSPDLHFSEQAIVWKAQRLSQRTCKKIPCRGSRKSPQLKCNPEDIAVCISVRARSVDEVWIVACISLLSLPSWQTSLMNNSTTSLVRLSQASCRETASVPLGPLF